MKEKLPVIFLASMVFWQVFETPAYGQNKALKLEQVINSLSFSEDKGKESTITAKKVRQVGVTFPLTLDTEYVLRRWGATDELIEAVRRNSPPVPKPITQTLNVITSPPESDVYIDNDHLGKTDATGKARFTDVTVGDRRVSVRKARYRDATFPLSLASDKEGQITANLELAVGFLTITTNVPNASIEISGLGRYENAVTKVEFPTGIYNVAITSPFYVTGRQEIRVSPGQETLYPVTLEIDSVARNQRIAEAQLAYSRRQYDRAITSAKTLVAVFPRDSQAITILAESLFMKEDFNAFSDYARQSIDVGGSLQVRLQHHHFYDGLHSIKLTLTSNSISFDPELQYPYCTVRQFTLPVGTIVSAHVEEADGSFFSKRPRGTYLELIMKDTKNPKKTNTLNFADPASVFAKDLRGILSLSSRPEAAQSLGALSQVIRYASLQNPRL